MMTSWAIKFSKAHLKAFKGLYLIGHAWNWIRLGHFKCYFRFTDIKIHYVFGIHLIILFLIWFSKYRDRILFSGSEQNFSPSWNFVAKFVVTELNSVTVMLVTTLCWWPHDGDWFEMLVADLLCWRLISLCCWFSQCIKSVTNISYLSSTHLVSNIRHQHRCNRFQPMLET